MNALITPYEPEPLPVGADPVATEPFEAVRQFGSHILALAGIMLVVGEPGTGKTYAVDSFASSLSIPVIKLHLVQRTRGNEILRKLLEALDLPTTATSTVLLEMARDALLGRELLLYIDEAHLLNREALQQVRWLFDQRGMRFGLILTGSDFKDAFASAPELKSRIARAVRFEKLSGRALVTAVQKHHPIFAATEPALLKELDRRYCAGLWRNWKHLLIAAAGYGANAETGITREIAEGSLGALPTGI